MEQWVTVTVTQDRDGWEERARRLHGWEVLQLGDWEQNPNGSWTAEALVIADV